MPRRARFAPKIARALHATKYLRIRAGDDHRFIAVWVVLADRRAVVRSWDARPDGWYHAFLAIGRGAVDLDGVIVPIRAAKVTRAALNSAVNAAFAAKYTTQANQRYVKGFATPRRMAHTLELMPDA